MRLLSAISLLVVTALALSTPVGAQATDRMNPIIALQEKGLPVFGIAHPAIVARGPGRGRGAAADPAAPPPQPPPAIVLSDVAKETVGYARADYLFTSGTSDTFLRYIDEIRKAGGSMRTHPFAAKIGIWHSNPTNVNNAIIRQLNADGDNGRYAQRAADIAIAAFTQCSPLRGLPQELYDVPRGWSNFTLNYRLPG